MSPVFSETVFQPEHDTRGENGTEQSDFFPLSLIDIRPHFYRAFRKEMSINLPREKPAAAILAEDSYTL